MFDGMTRRSALHLAGGALLAGLALPGASSAQSRSDREHRIDLDVPILSEEPAAVPIRVGLDHPMEPDHYIQSIEVSIDRDPVPAKGKFLFTPANGRPWVAYQMRSGTGGWSRPWLSAAATGRSPPPARFASSRGAAARRPSGVRATGSVTPSFGCPSAVKLGEPFEVRARVSHGSHTGLVLKQGKFVRVLPEYYLRSMTVWLDDQQVSQFQMTSAVSPNPLIRFPLRIARPARLRVEFTNSEEQRWEVSQAIRG